MARENIRRFYPGSLAGYFLGIHDLLTTQGLRPCGTPNPANRTSAAPHPGVNRRPNRLKPCRLLRVSLTEPPMPYALFSSDDKLSKAYPTEADVWRHARLSGLVVDVVSEEEGAAPRPVLDNDYEIRPCRPGSARRPRQEQGRRRAQRRSWSCSSACDRAAKLGRVTRPSICTRTHHPRSSRLVSPASPPGAAFTASRHQRRLLRSPRHANPLAVEPPDGAGHLEHLARRAGGVLHIGDLIGRKERGVRISGRFGRGTAPRMPIRTALTTKARMFDCPPARPTHNSA